MLFDAHCHLQDPRLASGLQPYLDRCRKENISGWMINSTRESDWNAVSKLAANTPGIKASYGLHPWWQDERSPHWASLLEQKLRDEPTAGIGETGLDQWMQGANLSDQIEILNTHLELARQFDRPISIHCLKAWPELKRVINLFGKLPKGFLLHSYAGPPEMTAFWVEAGAYFSFSPAFLAPRKTPQRATFNNIPLDRLLIETDAPDMPPPSEMEVAPLKSAEGKHLNHPVNLVLCLKALATDRGITEQKMAEILRTNSNRLFGSV
ncbi:MAG: TatD family hydrolase [Verrucomicrobiota bacterium]